ncbi:hypothetical protein Y032_0018g3644 [Ancylostoma ceylanicum]|uniref:Uncharacterized protein n=1 Tax=Ancylostoma ceylanicum TaxID=53326 RepID=A0A016V3G1_9BILA|nr:hypothetical protein Y032_0018g3644 [Ancylostoma ceylanicum]
MKNSANSSSKLEVPLRTVQNIVKQWKEEGHVQPKEWTGWTPNLGVDEDGLPTPGRFFWIIKKRIDRKDYMSLDEMAKQLKISRKAVQIRVKNELGLRSYRPLNVREE